MRNDWTETTLDGIAEYLNGYPFKPAELGEVGTPVIRIKQLLDANEKVDRTRTSIPPRNHLQDGDIVFSWSGTLAVRIWDRGAAFLNQHLFKVVEKDGVIRNFLPLVIEHAIEELEAKSHGTTMKHITKQTLLPHKVNLPPLQEQRRIVDLISAVDSYNDALQQQADSARKSRNAVLHEMLSADGDGWQEYELGDLLLINRGGSPRPIQSYFTNDLNGINWIKIADATASEKYIYQTKQKISRDGIARSRLVKSGDFILSNSMSYGRPYIMRTEGCIHDGWLLLSQVGDHFDEDFLYNLLLTDSVQKQFDSLSAGSGVQNPNIEVVKKVRVRIPSIKEQRRISVSLNSFDDFLLELESMITSAGSLRSGLLSDLLSGQHEIPASYDSVMGAA
jgi:type I restriction enzyme S subunit